MSLSHRKVHFPTFILILLKQHKTVVRKEIFLMVPVWHPAATSLFPYKWHPFTFALEKNNSPYSPDRASQLVQWTQIYMYSEQAQQVHSA